ncbi:hypothetical protein ACFO0N_13070 [Halobium salinum]|uniref:DUF8215 domain-containing protein n=1 Tax=Halobium salinum TaxID=1364940 RepID=A0ABD5PDU3_9EURY|nr:hypothetical protein [Halobium salinum]
MAPSRGTDRATEERQLRSRTEEKDALGQWLESLFDALGEVALVCIPALLFALMAGEAVTKFVAAVVLSAFVGGVAAGRHGRLRVGPPWPRVTPLLAVLRLVYYNAVFFGAVLLSIAVAPDLGLGAEWSPVDVGGASLVAIAVVAAAVLAFPTVARALRQAVTTR